MFARIKHAFRLRNNPAKHIIIDATPHVYTPPMPLPSFEEAEAAMNRSYFGEKQPRRIAGSIER